MPQAETGKIGKSIAEALAEIDRWEPVCDFYGGPGAAGVRESCDVRTWTDTEDEEGA
jgi:hypothetical protein